VRMRVPNADDVTIPGPGDEKEDDVDDYCQHPVILSVCQPIRSHAFTIMFNTSFQAVRA
jgi:hypothetical protein